MADVLLFHHALGLTPGLRHLADALSGAGHSVTTPDLFDGHVFGSLDDGVAHAQSIGFGAIIERGSSARSDASPVAVVGFSLGVLPAQMLAQTDPAVTAAVLVSAAIPVGEFSPAWPPGVRLQLHMVEDDPWAEEDLPAARELAEAAGGTLYLYEGSGHLVFDESSPDHEPEAAGLMLDRVLEFLAELD